MTVKTIYSINLIKKKLQASVNGLNKQKNVGFLLVFTKMKKQKKIRLYVVYKDSLCP